MGNTQSHSPDFFPGQGLQDLLFDITGSPVRDLEKPPHAGEHAHTVDDEANVISLKFRRNCQIDTGRLPKITGDPLLRAMENEGAVRFIRACRENDDTEAATILPMGTTTESQS